VKHLPTLTFFTLCLFPALAWSCGYDYYEVPPKVYALDFLMLGLAAGTAFRLFLRPFTEMSEEMGAAIFLSCFFGSLGLGLSLTHNPGWGFGPLAVGALLLAPFGAVYPKNGIVRILFLGPTLLVAYVGVQILHKSWLASGQVQPQFGLMF